MIEIFTFNTSMMNGTVTMQTHTDAFASRELAERTRKAVIEANRKNNALGGFKVWCSEVTSTKVFETDGEVPILSEDT